MRDLEARFPGRVGVKIGYDEALSHRMFAGGDAVLVPSRFEPCGLTQMYGLRYGTLPVVAATGGLVDTVIGATPATLAAGVATGHRLPADRRAGPSGWRCGSWSSSTPIRRPGRRCSAMRWSIRSAGSRSAAAYAGLYDGLRA